MSDQDEPKATWRGLYFELLLDQLDPEDFERIYQVMCAYRRRMLGTATAEDLALIDAELAEAKAETAAS